MLKGHQTCLFNEGSNRRDVEMLLAAAHNSFDRFTPDEIAEYVSRGWLEKSEDSYKPLYPILTSAQENEIIDMSSEIRGDISKILSEIMQIEIRIMQNHAPSAIKDICEGLAGLNNNLDALYYTMENLCADGWLIIPQARELLTVYTVI